LYFAGGSRLGVIKEAALKRLHHSLKPNSRVNYKAYFGAFIMFTQAFSINLDHFNHSHVNLFPPSQAKFNPLQHLARGVLFLLPLVRTLSSSGLKLFKHPNLAKLLNSPL